MFVEKKLENVEMSVEKIFFTFTPSSVTWESYDANQVLKTGGNFFPKNGCTSLNGRYWNNRAWKITWP